MTDQLQLGMRGILQNNARAVPIAKNVPIILNVCPKREGFVM